jgi:hypothetical protein
MSLIKKLKERRNKRKKSNKKVVGEMLTKAGRKRRNIRKNVKKINKMVVSREKKKPGSGQSMVDISKVKNPSKISPTGKIKKKGLKSIVMTEGGAYAKYEKGSKSAKSFRSTFKSKCAGKGDKDTFTWQGRKYSCRRD